MPNRSLIARQQWRPATPVDDVKPAHRRSSAPRPRYRPAYQILSLLLCLLSGQVQAFQFGQLEARSVLGEPLEARVTLYGAASSELAATSFNVLPDITAARGSAERALAAEMTIEAIDEGNGFAHLRLSSSTPVNEPIVRFRLRSRSTAKTRIAHYTLAVDPPRYVQTRTPEKTTDISSPAATADAADGTSTRTYGPVRPGHTLWRILSETGLTGGDTTAVINEIVARNPQAFVNGDADRLRVGVMLDLPAAAQQASAASAVDKRSVGQPAAVSASEPPPQAARTVAVVATTPATATAATHDAATAARLQALGEKFAAIRARYERQRAAEIVGELAGDVAGTTLENSDSGALATTAQDTEEVAGESLAESGVDEVASAPPASPAQREPALPVTSSPPAVAEPPLVSAERIYQAAIAIAALLALLILGRVGMGWFSRWRRNKAARTATAEDEELVQEIARKAEKRLQLEDEVKRRMTEKRSPSTPSTIERSVEAADNLASLDEIENRIAHGQYAEAEAMLNQVIKDSPQNYRAKMRLAEIYYLNERVDDFVALAQALSGEHRADIGDDGWQRIMRMGKAIAPDRPPFSGPVEVGAEA